MKKIGIIGGLSYASSAESYRLVAEKSNQCLSGFHTAEIVMISINPTEIISTMHSENWEKVTDDLVCIAETLEKMGAACIMMPCNTVHRIANELQQRISVPLINIIDSVGKEIKKKQYQKVGLLGTRFTMENGFYQANLRQELEVDIILPDQVERATLHHMIFNEMCQGNFSEQARSYVTKICNRLYHDKQCEAVILGCTELSFLVHQEEVCVPLINTIDMQAKNAVEFAYEN